MVSIKPKVGVFLITATWFRKVGMQRSVSELTNEIDEIAQSIVKDLSEFSIPMFDGVISSIEVAEKAASKAATEDIDALLISSLIWCEDIVLKTILKKFIKKPVIFAIFMPYKDFKTYMSVDDMLKGTGTVGALQMSGFLSRGGIDYEPVCGFYKDATLFGDIKKHLYSIVIKKELKDIICGVLPFRCDQMTTTYVDEFNLHKIYGINLKYIENARVKSVAQSTSASEIDEYRTWLKGLNIKIEVDETNLLEGIKYSIALEKVVKEENLKILAINDVCSEMHDAFGMRPCLVNPWLSEYGISVAMEADIAAGIAMHILSCFTSSNPFYSELLCGNISENSVLMGHIGYYDYQNNDPNYPVRIISDPEYKNSDRFTGACIYYKYKPGPVTMVNSVYDGTRIKWTTIEGTSLEGPPKLEGYCHAYCKFEKPIKDFLIESVRSGVSQHWSIIPGMIAEDLKIVARWNNIAYSVLK